MTEVSAENALCVWFKELPVKFIAQKNVERDRVLAHFEP